MTKMNLTELRSKLIAAAKAQPPNENVPYAFEKRVMARLQDAPSLDLLGWWSRALWRGAAVCLGICLLLSVWSILPVHHDSNLDFSEALERTLLAPAADSDHGW